MVDVFGRLSPERLVQPPVEPLVGQMVLAADDVRDAKVDVVHHAGQVVRRGSIGPEKRDPVEAVAQLRSRLSVRLPALTLTNGPLVPLDAQPLEIGDDRLFAAGKVAGGIGVVDSEQHPVTQAAIRNRGEGVADMQRAGRAGGKTDALHSAGQSTLASSAGRLARMVSGERTRPAVAGDAGPVPRPRVRGDAAADTGLAGGAAVGGVDAALADGRISCGRVRRGRHPRLAGPRVQPALSCALEGGANRFCALMAGRPDPAAGRRALYRRRGGLLRVRAAGASAGCERAAGAC